MLKFKGVIFENEEKEEIIVNVPEEFQFQFQASSEAAAHLALGGLLAKGYEGVKALFPN